MKRILSCIQPTGDLHLGNYFGAVKNWVDLQNNYKCFYGVVDNHSMTAPYVAENLRVNTWKMAFQLLAAGIKPENLFIQSLIPEHTELCWILSCVTSMGELSKMTQFKDKRDQIESSDKQAFISSGLFFYPVLQAADILIYKADYVPIGKDQEQHLELSRNIAARFNFQFGKEYFVHPEPLFTDIPKLLSPADPTKKMSKSLGEKHYINLFGDTEFIKKQIKSAVTDSGEKVQGEIAPGVQNLFTLLKACGKSDLVPNFTAQYQSGIIRYSELKGAVTEAVLELVTPFKERLSHIEHNSEETKEIIRDNSAKIRETARETLREVKEIVGLLQ